MRGGERERRAYIPKVGNMGNDITWGFLGDMGILAAEGRKNFSYFRIKNIYNIYFFIIIHTQVQASPLVTGHSPTTVDSHATSE